jgi:flagellin-like hook-associated protein FlgL
VTTAGASTMNWAVSGWTGPGAAADAVDFIGTVATGSQALSALTSASTEIGDQQRALVITSRFLRALNDEVAASISVMMDADVAEVMATQATAAVSRTLAAQNLTIANR